MGQGATVMFKDSYFVYFIQLFLTSSFLCLVFVSFVFDYVLVSFNGY